MPLYNYKCGTCGREARRILQPGDVPVEIPCPGCGEQCRRNPTGATSRTVEILDSPLRGKKLERLVDAERLFRERAEKDKI